MCKIDEICDFHQHSLMYYICQQFIFPKNKVISIFKTYKLSKTEKSRHDLRLTFFTSLFFVEEMFRS